MARPHMSTSQLIHLDDETAAPVATIKTRELPSKRLVHVIKITSGAWTVAEFTIFSDFDGPLLVTQIDERPGAEDLVAELAKEREGVSR